MNDKVGINARSAISRVVFMTHSIMIQNIDDRTAEWIEETARRLGVTAEAVIIRLIHKEIESDRKTADFQIYSDLDELAGTWSEDETAEFLDAVKDFSQIDDKLWK